MRIALRRDDDRAEGHQQEHEAQAEDDRQAIGIQVSKKSR